MKGGAWLCLFAPLVGTVLILLGGTRFSRRAEREAASLGEGS